MSTWVKWWKNKTVVTVFIIALIAMVLSFITAYFITWGWILSIIIAGTGGILIRRVIINAVNKWIEE